VAFPHISAVRAYTSKPPAGDGQQGADCHDVASTHWINGHPTPIANPMSGYAQYAKTRTSWGINALGSCVVEVEASDGTIGIGVTTAGEPGCYIVEKHLSRFVEGQDPRNIETMWDQMWRATINYGRKGLPLQALSAIDLALWDLLGKLRGEPVYALLGGKTKDRLPVYCTSSRPDLSKGFGFCGAKIPCPYGPADGDEGFRKNVEFFKGWREKVGPDFPLALDCYMALSVPYAIKLAKALAPYNLKWMEEFLPPDDYDGYKEVRQALLGTGVLTTTGEHEYTRYGFRRLIADRAVDILQPDVTWLGGLTECRRVVAQAAAYDIPVIPHGSSIYSYHMQCAPIPPPPHPMVCMRACMPCTPCCMPCVVLDGVSRLESVRRYAFANCPVAEFINLSHGADEISGYFGGLFTDEPLPKDGFIDLPDKPGFGVTLNRENLVRPYPRSAEESAKQAQATIDRPVPKVAKMPL